MAGTPTKADLPDAETVHHVSRRQREGRAGGQTMSLNLTPMIDVTFLLLIYFLLATSWTTAEGIIPSRLPRQQGLTNQQQVPMSPIRVRLVEAGVDGEQCDISVDNYAAAPQSFEELYDVLLAIRRDLGLPEVAPPPGQESSGDEPPLIIVSRPLVHWDHVVNAYNAGVRSYWRDLQFGSD